MEGKDFETARRALNNVTDTLLKGESVPGIGSGYAELDDRFLGLRNGNLIVVGGRPSMGKTAFALNLLENAAVEGGKTCLYISLDHPELMGRLLRQRARLDLPKKLEDSEREKIAEVSRQIENAPIIMDYRETPTATQIAEAAREYASRNDIRLIIIDYLQLISAEKDEIQRKMSRREKILKGLARELECPVVVLSQLSRKIEKRRDRRPRLSDLHSRGRIEEVADSVLLLYRDEYYHIDSERKGIMEVIVAKGSADPNCTVELVYMANCGKIFSPVRPGGN